MGEYFSEFSDASLYLVIACIGTLLMIIRIALMLSFGLDADVDVDVDFDADGGHGFGMLSLFSILAFMAGFGWVGFAARTEWGFGGIASAASGFTFGFFMMLLAASMMFYIKKLNSSPSFDIRNTIDHTGTAYLKIPAAGEGLGEVQITVDGTQKVLPAKTNGPAIDSFTSVKVIEVEDDGTLIVIQN